MAIWNEGPFKFQVPRGSLARCLCFNMPVKPPAQGDHIHPFQLRLIEADQVVPLDDARNLGSDFDDKK